MTVLPVSVDSPVPPPSAAALAAEVVMPFTQGLRGHASVHEQATRQEIARRVAALKGCACIEEIPQPLWPRRTYLVPSDTLLAAVAQPLGIVGPDDLLGGVVPHAFVATKAISHPLVAADAAAPAGWNTALAGLIHHAVLPGFAAFSRPDAQRAGEALLAAGAVRVKPVGATGGRGQTVVRDAPALVACLAALDHAAVLEQGVVLERNLTEVRTYSVGQVRVAGVLASYHGVQYLTTDNTGAQAYGGSDLTVVRGDFHALRAALAAGPVSTAVDQALAYDAAVRDCYPGFFASRINYDVAQGLDADGQWRSGVLEQSWRIGGATGAEVAALEAFQADGALHTVQARCVERYGPAARVPAQATLYFQGEDPEAGPLTKYAEVLRDGHTA